MDTGMVMRLSGGSDCQSAVLLHKQAEIQGHRATYCLPHMLFRTSWSGVHSRIQ